ncbi:unnamed protein product [Rhizophagus irregularis]|nr:unnamed protein product [Rhizophagus irregularis]
MNNIPGCNELFVTSEQRFCMNEIAKADKNLLDKTVRQFIIKNKLNENGTFKNISKLRDIFSEDLTKVFAHLPEDNNEDEEWEYSNIEELEIQQTFPILSKVDGRHEGYDYCNGMMKTFPGLSPTNYMKVIVDWSTVKSIRHGCSNHRNISFRYIDKVSLPASANELPAYEAVHTMLRTLEHRLSKLTVYCTKLKVEHARLRRKRDYMYQEDI